MYRVLLSAVTAVLVGLQATPPAPQQLPVFRAGAHFVRVDAYPTQDGRPIEGLTADDFEVLEDGRPQKVDTFQFVKFPRWTPDGERRDPDSQRDAFALAADPARRVFVIYLDTYHGTFGGSHRIRLPLVTFLNRALGPQDLFGVLTPQQSPLQLALGQRTQSIEEQLSKYWWWGGGPFPLEPPDQFLEACGLKHLIGRRQLDKVFSDLEDLMSVLNGVRQERKNILLVTRGWPLPRRDTATQASNRFVKPPIGITNEGKLTLGRQDPNTVDQLGCQTYLAQLTNIDFEERHRSLLALARASNVAFHPINPEGLEASPTAEGVAAIRRRTNTMLELAENSDGIAVVNSNDLEGGLRRVADDLEACYVLGYYTSNTRWDGQLRKISVRLKPTGKTVRARREYRAPTVEEMSANRTAARAPEPAGTSAVEKAFATLARLRPGTTLFAHGSAVGDEIAVVAELAPSLDPGSARLGADVTAILQTSTGEAAATAKGRIVPGQRATVLRLPIGAAPGPWTADIEVRVPGARPEYERIAVSRASGGLLGTPLVFRTGGPAAGRRPAAAFQFLRSERLQIEVPLLRAVERRDARVLGRDGGPLAVATAVAEQTEGAAPRLIIDLALAALAPGDYLVEVTAGAGSTSDRQLVAIRVNR